MPSVSAFVWLDVNYMRKDISVSWHYNPLLTSEIIRCILGAQIEYYNVFHSNYNITYYDISIVYSIEILLFDRSIGKRCHSVFASSSVNERKSLLTAQLLVI